MGNGKGRWRERFSKFWESKRKKKEPSNQMGEIQSLTDSDEESEFIFRDSDGNVIVQNGRKTMEIMHPDYKQHIAEENFK